MVDRSRSNPRLMPRQWLSELNLFQDFDAAHDGNSSHGNGVVATPFTALECGELCDGQSTGNESGYSESDSCDDSGYSDSDGLAEGASKC